MQAEDDSMPLKPTRAGFVRGLPESMPIEEVIERGKEAGIQLNPSDVHSARYYMRQEALAKLSSRPVSVPQLVPSAPVARAKPAEAKPDAQPTNILGLRAANSGKEAAEPKSRRATAAPAKKRGKPAAPAPQPAAKLSPKLIQQAAKLTQQAAKLSPQAAKLTGSLEEQLRKIVMRIGTERARRIIEQIEELRV